MNDPKSFLLSKTLWGVVISMVAMFAPKLGFSPFSEGDVAGLTENIVALLGAALAIFGRITAKKKIKAV